MSRQRNIMEQGFEALCTGLEMFEAVFDEYARCHPRQGPRLKTDGPGTFEKSLCEEVEANHENQRRRA